MDVLLFQGPQPLLKAGVALCSSAGKLEVLRKKKASWNPATKPWWEIKQSWTLVQQLILKARFLFPALDGLFNPTMIQPTTGKVIPKPDDV